MRLLDLNQIHSPYVYLLEKEEDDYVAVTPSRSFLFWLTPGLEPCSPLSQSDTLPVKLKPTFVIETGFEPISSASKADMLPLHHSTILRFVRESNPLQQIDNL